MRTYVRETIPASALHIMDVQIRALITCFRNDFTPDLEDWPSRVRLAKYVVHKGGPLLIFRYKEMS
jgi:hypothetical protein